MPFSVHIGTALLRRCIQRLIQIPQNVINILKTDTQPHKVGRYPSRSHFIWVQLAVRRAGRMDCQTLGVTDICQVAQELKIIDKLLTSLESRQHPWADISWRGHGPGGWTNSDT